MITEDHDYEKTNVDLLSKRWRWMTYNLICKEVKKIL